MSDVLAERIQFIDGCCAVALFCNGIMTCAGRKWLFKAADPSVLMSIYVPPKFQAPRLDVCLSV